MQLEFTTDRCQMEIDDKRKRKRSLLYKVFNSGWYDQLMLNKEVFFHETISLRWSVK